MSLILAETWGTFDTLPASQTGGTFSVGTRNGYPMLRCNPSGAGNGIARITGRAADGSNSALSQTTFFIGGWVEIASNTNVNNTTVWLIQDAATHSIIDIVQLTGGNLQLRYVNGSNATTTIGSSFALGSGQHWLELKVSALATAGSTVIEVCLDGVVMATGTGLTVTNTSANRNFGSLVLGPATTATCDYYYGLTIADDSAYPGPCVMQVLVPNGTGGSGWASGTGATQAEVDEVDGSHANDGDTTYVKDSTSGDTMAYSLSNPTGTLSDIKAVVGYMICRDEGGASSFHLEVGRNVSVQATSNMDPGATYVYRALIATVDPFTSAAWTQTGVNAAYSQLVNAANVAARVTATGAFVIYHLLNTATATSTIPKLTSAATATQVSAMTATAASTIPKLTSAAVAVEAFKAAAASTLPKLTSAAVAVSGSLIQAAAASTIPKLTSSAIAAEKFIAAAASTIPKLTSAAQAASAYAVTIGASTIPKLLSAALGAIPTTAAAASTVPKLLSAAIGFMPATKGFGPYFGTARMTVGVAGKAAMSILGRGTARITRRDSGSASIRRPGDPS